jgi:hypothetical protein
MTSFQPWFAYTVLIKGCIGETYNIGGNNEQKNIDLVRMICDLMEEARRPWTNGARTFLSASRSPTVSRLPIPNFRWMMRNRKSPLSNQPSRIRNHTKLINPS